MLALDQEKLKAERRRQQRVEALDGLQDALGLDTLPLRIECFDISNLMGTHTVASMVVFEGGAPKKSRLPPLHDPRRSRRASPTTSRRWRRCCPGACAQWESQQDLSPHDPKRNESFATLPNLVVIDGGQGQLAAGLARCRASASAASPSSRWPSGSRRCSCPGASARSCSPHDTPALQLLQRVRDEAHRFAITHHRNRRDKAMTASVLDELPGRRPGAQAGAAQALRLARRRSWPPRREELEARPGPARQGRARHLTPPAPHAADHEVTLRDRRLRMTVKRERLPRLRRHGASRPATAPVEADADRASRTSWSSPASPAPASPRR